MSLDVAGSPAISADAVSDNESLSELGAFQVQHNQIEPMLAGEPQTVFGAGRLENPHSASFEGHLEHLARFRRSIDDQNARLMDQMHLRVLAMIICHSPWPSLAAFLGLRRVSSLAVLVKSEIGNLTLGEGESRI